MNTEFTTFRILKGKETLAMEWMNCIKKRKLECVKTLTREKMILESVFSFEKNERLFLSWFSIQKEDHQDVESSAYEIDKAHLKYWEECIDKSYTPIHQKHIISFMPDKVYEFFNDLYL